MLSEIVDQWQVYTNGVHPVSHMNNTLVPMIPLEITYVFSKAALILHFHLVCFWVNILSASKKIKKPHSKNMNYYDRREMTWASADLGR